MVSDDLPELQPGDRRKDHVSVQRRSAPRRIIPARRRVAAPAIAGTADRARRWWRDQAWMASATKPVLPILAAAATRAPDRHAWRSAACADVAPRSRWYCRRALRALARARAPAA